MVPLITDRFLDLVQGVVTWLIGLVPDSAAWDTGGFTSFMSDVGARAGWVSAFLPVGLAVDAFQLLIAVWAGLYAFRFIVKVLQWLHILGGSS